MPVAALSPAWKLTNWAFSSSPSRPGKILDLGLGQVRGGSLGGRLNSSPLLSRSFFVDKVNGSALMVVG